MKKWLPVRRVASHSNRVKLFDKLRTSRDA